MSDGPDVASFADTLIAWQREHGRQTLPWQRLDGAPADGRHAYGIWLAEIMLQQTQVAAVIPFYRRFLDRFPHVHALADASLDDVMQRWSGLGYYSRARNLHATARRVAVEFGGRFPDDPALLESLPGIGRSTAAAIAAFAYGRRAAILDGNVKRVLARLFGLSGVPTSSAFVRRAWTLAENLLPVGGDEADTPGDGAHDVERRIQRPIQCRIQSYTQGLMDLGATVCTPRRPSCPICPFRTTCIAHRDGREAELPERAARRSVPRRRVTLAVFTHDDAVLLQRRPPTGIWGGLWSLPEIASPDVETQAARIGTVAVVAALDGFEHGFTHFILEADVVRVELSSVDTAGLCASPDATRWVAFERLGEIGLPAPIRTLLATDPVRSPLAQRASASIQRQCG